MPLISRIKGNSFTFSNYKQDKKPNFYSLCSSATFSCKNSKLFYFSMIINDNKTYPRNWICVALFTHNQRWKISRDKWFTYWWIHFQHVPDNRAVCEGRWMKHVNGSLVVIHARNVPRRRITCLDKAKPTIAGAHAIKNQSANVSFFFFFVQWIPRMKSRHDCSWNENYRDTSLFFPRVRCSFLFEPVVLHRFVNFNHRHRDRRGIVDRAFHISPAFFNN